MQDEQLADFLGDDAEEQKDGIEVAVEDYNKVVESFGNDLRKAFAERSLKYTETCLIMYGDPKGFRTYLHLSEVVAQSILVWLVSNGYVKLTEKALVTEAEKAEREAKKDAPEKDDPVRVVETGGAYL